MTDENSSPSSPEPKPRVRRISNPRPKKTAPAKVLEADAPIVEIEFPVEEPQLSQDWPDAESVSEAPDSPAETKRKRRRRKGKGGKNQSPPLVDEISAPAEPPSPITKPPSLPLPLPIPQAQAQAQAQTRGPVNPEELAKKAWKIFLAEVSEEGVALIGDHDARELSKRCFRLAEIFIEEQGRRR